jgi:hypothetical protein
MFVILSYFYFSGQSNFLGKIKIVH